MKKLLIAIWLSIAVVSTHVAKAEEVLPSGIPKAEIGDAIESYVNAHEETTAGMAVSVFDLDGVIYENYFGFADREGDIPVDETTVFEWGSASKIFVWIAVLQLYEDGLIEFDEDILTYLPDNYLNEFTYDTEVTMMHLFNHEAGFQDFISGLFYPQGTELESLRDAIVTKQPTQIYEPGTVHGYSNWSTALAAVIVEEVSGMSFSDYVNEHIMSPLNMENTALLPDLSDNESVQYARQDVGTYSTGGTRLDGLDFMIELYPAGMATSTLEDFRTFGMALLTDGDTQLFNDVETHNQMLEPTKYYGDTDIGLNYHGMWSRMYAVETIGHGGSTAGFSSNFLFDPVNNIGVVVMTNQQNESIYNYEMMELVFGELADSELVEYIPEPVPGIFKSMRTISEGPFKLYELTSYRLSGQGDITDFWMLVEGAQGSIIEQTQWNLVEVPTSEVIFLVVVIGSLLIGFVYSIITLVTHIVQLIRKRKKFFNSGLRIINMSAALLQILVLINLLLFAVGVISFLPGNQIVIFFVIFIILAILLLVTGILLLIKNIKDKHKRHWIYFITVYFALMTVFFIFHYNLYMFWAV